MRNVITRRQPPALMEEASCLDRGRCMRTRLTMSLLGCNEFRKYLGISRVSEGFGQGTLRAVRSYGLLRVKDPLSSRTKSMFESMKRVSCRP